MEVISRITIRRNEMGEAGDGAQRRVADKSLVIFRVLGRSPERAMKALAVEKARNPDQAVVLAIAGKRLSEGERNVCSAAIEHGIRQSMHIAFCGGDPSQIFGKLAVDGKALKWFPSIPALVSTYEIDGGRQAANPAK